ncbi:hypothetical protein LARI1_G002648 [Lachnellula arida]|uniref:DUF4470 domain-containing protein n=1 Tax=Lachnellula arida TaxID=1316785 RepID=A0A8T9BPC6_9HELO|nr:hypothetical protein LARI1_G002648 [Lachnellula arida]
MAEMALITQFPCANTEQVEDGGKSKACQTAHWPLHKVDCKSPLMKPTWKPAWETQNRSPDFMMSERTVYGKREDQVKHGIQKYLWGNVPAMDILNCKQNEGESLPEDLRLLFAASGDIRNVVSTLAELPSSFSGTCNIVVNDKDPDIVARNTILLLTALHYKPEQAVVMMIHLWYSALISAEIFSSLRDDILPLIEDVCTKIKDKPLNSLQSKTWKYGSRSLRLVLKKSEWFLLPSYFQVPSDLSATEAQQIRMSTTLAPSRKDYVDRALYNRPSEWRVCRMKFREDGILLPFGSPRDEFKTPNPTFYQANDFWPMMDSADPVEGWPLKDWFNKAPAKKDIYGSLFLYVQEVLLRFCRRIERLDVRFQLLQVDALELPKTIENCGIDKHSFDRIEVSNIADMGYLGPHKTLFTFGPLLKTKSQNTHATLLTLFLNATHEMRMNLPEEEQLALIQSQIKLVAQYIKPTPETLRVRPGISAGMIKIQEAVGHFYDYDSLFELFMNRCGFKVAASFSSLEMKGENTVQEKWPMRLRKGATQEEFELLLASGHTGSERYVEWRSAR